jgi:hypothetical protein
VSRHVRGAPPEPLASTSTTMFFDYGTSTPLRPGTLRKLVDVVCDDCGAKAITFSKDGPSGWTRRQRHWRTSDLCPECSAKPEPPSTGDAYA